MPAIYQLPPSVVNQIAAGEVIERPASVVKELMENSLDAGATRVDVAVEQGGLELIRVSDNGRGIPAEEFPLAVASHATSKIRDANDLFRVGTLGFRGEALASIAAVSRLSLRSRAQDAATGAELEVVGGVASEVTPCGLPPGTTLEIANLFFNTPVRRKFLKSAQTEMGHISEAFTRLALAHPHLHFTLRHNDRLVHELPAGEEWLERIRRVYGQELTDALLWVESTEGEIELAGYVAEPSQSRANARMQYLFLNGRFIRDRSLQHALAEAYRGLMLTGRQPITFLSLKMPPDVVDVNVHPTKLEVRFQDGGRIYSQLLGTLRTKFLTSDLTARLQPVGAGAVPAPSAPWEQAEFGGAGAAIETLRGNGHAAAELFAPWSAHDAASSAPLEITLLDRPNFAAPPPHATPAPAWDRESQAGVPAMQIHNRYLITENGDGLVVIDQHALHERILYEQLKRRILAGPLESQRLLVPEPVDLSAAEAALALEHAETLEQLGLEVQPFGGDTVLVLSQPVLLARHKVRDLLREVLEKVQAGGRSPERRDLLDELLHMMSCKAAVKAGDRLAAAEIQALLRQRHLVEDAHHCPHGRPTALFFTREELDRQFKRT
jgi:DNA mismatch repair protein MutL